MEYFDKITEDQYNAYRKNKFIFDLEVETKYYCELDCIILYKVIEIFSKYIFNLFKLDIFKYPTLPSLAFAIFRSNFF